MATTRTAGGAAFSFRCAQRTRLRQRRSRRRRAFQARRIRVLRDGTLVAADEDMGMTMQPLCAGARERATLRPQRQGPVRGQNCEDRARATSAAYPLTAD